MWDVNIYKAFKISSLQTLELGMSAAFVYLFIYYNYSQYLHRSVITAHLYKNRNVQKLPHADKSYPVHKVYLWKPFRDH